MTAPVVLITGASGGLGVPVTETFLGAGFRVSAVARRWPDSGPGADAGLVRLEGDVGNEASAQLVVQKTLSTYGRIDALIHLVGGFAGGDGVAETPVDQWQQMMSLNCWSAVTMMRAAIPPMRAAGRGRVIVIASQAASDPPSHYAAYSASKAALIAVARSAAAELKKTGVTVNAVLPGTIDTEANRKAMGAANASRWVKPASIGSLLLWLCSDAGRDVNGAMIPMDGRV
jgi:NAD(P)-dependent dehydrogenase (short-subunit alcohol dehydrogenase family)